MTDRGGTLVETVAAITLLGVGATVVLGALQTLIVSTTMARQRLQAALELATLREQATIACDLEVGVITLTDLDPCPHDGPRRVVVAAGSGQSHRHLTMIVEG